MSIHTPLTLREIRSLVIGRRAAASVQRLEIGGERRLTLETQIDSEPADLSAELAAIDDLIVAVDEPGWTTIESRGTWSRDGRMTWECRQRRGGS